MKKILFTLCALVTINAMVCGAATTATKTISGSSGVLSNFDLDEIISVSATHSPSSTQTNGTLSGNRWYVYPGDNNGQFSINAKEGYIIQKIKLTYTDNGDNGIVISTQSGNNIPTDKQVLSNTDFNVNAQSIVLYVGHSGTKTTGMARVTQFSVTYDEAPTGVSLDVPATMDVTVGNKFQIFATVAPSTNVFQNVTWSTNASGVVDVDKNGIIDVKTTGEATITATTINGYTASCKLNAVATTDESITEYFNAYGNTTTINASVTGKQGNTGIYWILKNWKRSSTDDMIGGVQGVELQNGSNYIAYNNNNANPRPLEGGVKRVAFQWRAIDATKPVYFDVDNTASGTSLIKFSTVVSAQESLSEPQTFCRDIKQASNYQFRIRIADTKSSNVVFGPVTITPYLLFKEIKSEYDYSETQSVTLSDIIINNTGTTPTYEITTEGAKATIENGVLNFAPVEEEFSIKASWNDGKVFTTTTIAVHALPVPDFSIDGLIDGKMTKTMYDGAFTPTPIVEVNGVSVASPEVTYTSSDENIVKAENGGLTILAAGEVTITANLKASSTHQAATTTFTLTISGITEDAAKVVIETYEGLTEPSEGWYSGVVNYTGKQGYEWSVKYYQFGGHKVGDADAVRLAQHGNDGYISAIVEGGAKALAFDWMLKGGAGQFASQISMDDKSYMVSYASGVPMETPYHCEIPLEVKKNATLKIANGIGTIGSAANYGPITIVPYLLFTKKNFEYQYSEKQSLALSDIIINNTGIPIPSYAISGGAQATLSNGVVTFAEEEETFTITATWGAVSTTTNITVHALPHPTFTIADVVATMYDGTATPTPEVKVGGEPVASPVITYTSSDENIVKVENEGKVLSILAAGSVTITANLEASAAYQAATTTFTLTVSGIQEGDANKVKESYTNFKIYTGWSDDKSFEYDGDNTPYKWTIHYFQHTADMLGTGKPGIKLASNGSGYISATMEGGIKAVGFEWMVPSNKSNIQATITAGTVTKTFDYTLSNVTRRYECALEQKSNVEFKLTNGKNDDIYGPITIVPYLLYTKKDTTINPLDGTTFTMDKLINNTGVTIEAGQTDIVFSIISENEEVASINAETGEVTPLKAGTVTIQAAWGEVTTTYELTINCATFTPAFAETEVEKTMDNPAFTIALNGVPDDATGEKTYSSSNERVAKVDDDGLVTIYGIGETTIKVEIAQDDKYNEASAQYKLTVSEPIDEADEVTEAFTGQSWVLADTEIKGDLCDWITHQTRRSQSADSIVSKGVNMGAEWMSGAAGSFGYIQSKAAVDGGVKRIYFTWVKTNDKEANRSFKVTVGDVEDVVDLTGLTEGTYWHNFNIRENSVIRIDNNSASNFKAGPIVITPYIFYQHRADTIMATSYVYPTVYKQTLIDNTGSVGEITYESDNTTAAEVSTTGDVTIKAADEDSVTITATWKWGENDDEVVTTSYKLFITAKQKRSAEFTNSTMTVARGETPVNDIILGSPAGDSEPEIIYESSDKEVAVIVDNQVTTVGPGTATITAHIGETTKCLLQDITYTLTVTYEPAAGTYFTETFPNTTTTGYTTKTEHINGLDNVYQWNMQQYRRTADDIFGGEQGTRIRYTTSGSIEAGYIEMDGNQEGGIKEVNFNYCASGSDMQIHYYVQVGENVHDFHPAGTSVGAKKMQYAHDFNVKSNTQLRIYLNTQETPQQTYPIIGEIKITPYLLYTRKDITINLADYTESTFINDKLIDNRDDEVAIVYSIISENNGVATIDDATGEVTPIKAGTITIQAAWTPTGAETAVSTTYNLTIEPSTTLISEDDENLAELVEEKDGETLDITLKRTMEADGAYSTIFLPFAMNATQIAAVFGGGTQVAQLLNSELENNVLTFNFDFVTEMSACVPYLIKPTQDVDEANIEDVTIVKPQDPVTVEGGKFHGILAKQPAMDIDGLYFLGDDNILVTYPEIQTQEVQGLRAYFTLANPTPQLVARCVIGHTHPTILPLVDGKPVNGVKKVIMNNQMIIIRNTDMYNAQGIKIQ